jgi:hypothetical protein
MESPRIFIRRGSLVAATVMTAVIAGVLFAVIASAQSGAYGGAVTIDNRVPGGSVVAASSRPTICGQASPGDVVSFTIQPGGISLSATAGPDGRYCGKVGAPLGTGTYTLTVDGRFAATFAVGPAPAPPNTGLGQDGGDNSALSYGIGAIVVAGLIILGFFAVWWRNEQRSRANA